MAWYLTQSVYAIADDPGNNRRLYRTDVYLNASGYMAYSGYGGANGGGSVDGQGFSWGGPSAASLNNSSVVINTSDFWIYGDANGYHGDVGASSWFNGGGGYAPGYITASASTSGFNYDRKPDAPSTVSITLNADKSIFVQSNVVSSPAGTATYYIAARSSANGGSTWGAWSGWTTIGGNARSYTYAAGTLTYGLTWQFKMYASNSDGSSAETVSNSPASVFLPAGGRRFDGSNFNPTSIAKRHNGTDFVTLTIAKRHNGTSFVDMT